MKVLIVAWLCLALASEAHAARVVLAIGNDVGASGEADLRYAARDAARMAALMTSLGGAHPDDVITVSNRDSAALTRALADLTARAQRHGSDVEVVVYYSGHGDETALHLFDERFSVARLRDAVEAIPARLHVMIIDACSSQSGGRRKGLVADAPFAVEVEPPAGPRGTVVIRSSSPGESAQESDDLQGGVFTHYLLSGLRGAADTNSDDQVTLAEAYAHAYHRTLTRSAASTGPVQHASAALDLRGAGPLVVTRVAVASATLLMPAGRDVQYIVSHLPSGRVVAESWAKPQEVSRLALPAGRFLVQRRAPGRYGVAEIVLPYGGQHTIAGGDFDPREVAQLRLRGGVDLVRRHELSAGYLAVANADAMSHGGRLGYALRWRRFLVGLGASVRAGSHISGLNQAQRLFVGGDARLIWRGYVAPLEFRIGAGAAVQWIQQTLRHVQQQRLDAAGYDTSRQAEAVAAGPLASLGAWIPVAGRFGVHIELIGALMLFQQAGDTAVQPNVAATIALGLEL